MTQHDTWLREWLLTPISTLPEGVILDTGTLCQSIRAYRDWHDGGGLQRLVQQAGRLSRDHDRVMDALNETWLDVRSRMADCVLRASSGRSFPRLQTVQDVERYHLIQLRLRLQGRWSRSRREVPLCDLDLHSTPRAEALVETRQSALPLRFAACWSLADIPQRSPDKDMDWWWSMLRHSLDIEKLADLGGARNDPTEALDRLRLRLAFAQGLRPWLCRWAVGQADWSDLSVSLPRQRPDHRAVEALLPTLRAATGRALEDAGLDEAERLGLEKVLIRGATVRGNLHRFTGDRRARATALCEQLGMATCKQMMTRAVLC